MKEDIESIRHEVLNVPHGESCLGRRISATLGSEQMLFALTMSRSEVISNSATPAKHESVFASKVPLYRKTKWDCSPRFLILNFIERYCLGMMQ